MMLDMCANCGSLDIDGPRASREKTGMINPKYRKILLINCRGCDHVYQVTWPKNANRDLADNYAAAMWRQTRRADLMPTRRLAAQMKATPTPKEAKTDD